MLRRPAFYKFFFYSVLTVVVGNNVFSFAKDYALFLGAGPALATSLVGIASLCNGIGRLFSGCLYDVLGRKGTMLCANLLDILAPAIALTAVLVRSLALGILGLCCIGLGYGFSPTVTAAVTLKQGAEATEDELIALCRERIAGYKCPKRVVFAESIPTSALGKVLRRQVREGLEKG
jgi:MFS family permease